MLLGVDTGGTYTDAVLYDPAAAGAPGGGVIAKAKALTTHGRLEHGVGAAIDRVMAAAGCAAGEIRLASLSTTLATNALVEGQGAPAGLILIGFDASALDRAGLRDALGDDPAAFVAGGHDSAGAPLAPLDREALRQSAAAMAGRVTAFAVTAQFATRNPEHERAAREILTAETGLPVTSGHELTARLDAPRRALTTLLNARLIGLLADLIAGAEALLAARGVDAPLMVVRGDGALMSAATARDRPIETILSGPAASLVGAAALTGLQEAVVSDIGGTTTDIARLVGGAPLRDDQGAVVGGWRTLVEAAAIRTYGLGGDSLVDLDPESDALTLGPRRATPISLLAVEHGALVAEHLERWARAPRIEPMDGRFAALAQGDRGDRQASAEEAALIARLGGGPEPLDRLAPGRKERAALERLTARGAVRIAAFTPSDAAHVLGRHEAWDAAAARAAAALFARRKDRFGRALAASAEALSAAVVDRLTRLSAERLIDAARDTPATGFATGGFLAEALDRQMADASPEPPFAPGLAPLVVPSLQLAAPVIGLGASAPIYYPAIATTLLTEAAVPAHADVANAVGAVAGLVTVRREATILPSGGEGYRVAIDEGVQSFAELADATDAARDWLMADARAAALAAGAAEPEARVEIADKSAVIEGQTMVVERRLMVVASGRPSAVGGAED